MISKFLFIFPSSLRSALVGALAVAIAPVFTAQAESVVIGALGDYGSAAYGSIWATNELLVANLVKSWNPAFIITLGDNNYEYGEAATMDLNVGQFFHEYIYPYSGNYGAGAISNRFFPSLGNHDWYATLDPATAANPYLAYFTLPGNERYYSYRHGVVEIFALDSDSYEPDGVTADSTQGLWLRDRLAASTALWRLVYFHHAPFSSGREHGTYTGENAYMNWPFKQWGATVVMAAHDHIYERVFTNGLNYFVNGLGGDERDMFRNPPVAGSQIRFRDDYGALRIEATETNLSFRFYTVMNRLIDGLTIDAMQAHLELLPGSNPLRIRLTGSVGRNYITEAATDLQDWTPISTNQAASGGTIITDAPDNGVIHRFYRARTGQ